MPIANRWPTVRIRGGEIQTRIRKRYGKAAKFHQVQRFRGSFYRAAVTPWLLVAASVRALFSGTILESGDAKVP